MAKKIESTVEETDEGGVALTLAPSRKFKGSDEEPIDVETGESVFDDLSPRFVRELEEATKAKPKADESDEDADEEVDVETVPEADDEADTDSVDEVDEADDTDEEEDKGKKSAWEKRLNRSDRLVEETRREAAELRARLSQQEDRVKAAADETKYTTDKTKLETELVTARKTLSAAIEAGDTEAQVAANEKLADLKGDLKVLEVRHVDSKLQLQESQSQRTNSAIVKTKVEQWTRKHGRFNTDKEFGATARAVDSQVNAAGFNPETDEYYKELDRRMAKFYPKEFGVKKAVPKVRKHPASGIRQNEGGAPARTKPKSTAFEVRNGRIYLSPRQVEIMRQFQLDPTDPNHVRDFVEQNR